MNYITCPKCKYSVSSESGFCSVCNYEFDTFIDEPFYIKSDKPYTNPDETNPLVTELKDSIVGRIRFKVKRSLFKLVLILGLTLAYVIYHGIRFQSFSAGSTAIVFFICLFFFMRK